MDELSPMFQEIEFHERWRGYDPDEVDAYVDRVAKVAAVAHGRLAELHERVESAEARDAGTGEATETLTRTLVLAQRTADAAIAEAREEADRMTTDAAMSAQAILAAAEAEAEVTLRGSQAEASALTKDSEERAARLLAEAETDRRQIVADAEKAAAEAATSERERLAVEVAELQQYRAFLVDDIEILERYLTEERHQLTASLSALTDLLDSPEAFRASRVPQTSGVEIDESLFETRLDEAGTQAPSIEEPSVEEQFLEAPSVEEPPVEEPPASELTTSEPASAEPPSEPEPEPTQFAPTIDLVAEEEITEHEAEPAFETVLGFDDLVNDSEIDLDQQHDEPTPEVVAPAEDNAYATMPEYGAAESTSASAVPDLGGPQRLVTAADLETSQASGSRINYGTGPVTAPVPTLEESSLFAAPAETTDDPFLAQLRDAVASEPVSESDEDALSAFFDQEEDNDGRSWFGRRG